MARPQPAAPLVSAAAGASLIATVAVIAHNQHINRTWAAKNETSVY